MINKSMVIGETEIRADSDGRFCLNDLQRAATIGRNPRTVEVHEFMRRPETKDLIEAILNTGNTRIHPVSAKRGRSGGTFVCKEVVYAYAMWISPAFNLKVIRAYDSLVSAPQDPAPKLDNTAATMALLQCSVALLNPSESGKIVMLQKAGKAIGADTSFLPEYVEDSAPGHVGSMDTAAATALLTEFDVGMSARAFNKLAESNGLIEKRTRSTHRGESSFWCLTKRAESLGKNITSPQNPRETQPHWYRQQFGETLRILGIK